MKIDYIDFFQNEVTAWMKASNQKSQELGFGTYAYWEWGESIYCGNLRKIRQ